MNKELQKIISKECMNLGLNTAHDFDGIETEEDLVIYTKAIIKKYKSLINKPVETTNEQPNYLKLIYEELKKHNDRLAKRDIEAKNHRDFLNTLDSDGAY